MTTAERLRREGRQEGKSETVIKLLTKKFGVLSKELKDKIQQLDIVTLEALIDNIFDYQSLEDLNKFFN